MVPRNSQQLSEQLTSSSEEQLLNKWQKPYFGAKNDHFLTKKAKTGKKFGCQNSKVIYSLINSK